MLNYLLVILANLPILLSELSCKKTKKVLLKSEVLFNNQECWRSRTNLKQK